MTTDHNTGSYAAIPPHIRKLLGLSPLLSTEDRAIYEELLLQCARVIQPTDIIEWLLVRDYVNAQWEAQRYRNLVPQVIQELTKAKFQRAISVTQATYVSEVWGACMRARSVLAQPQTETDNREAAKEPVTEVAKEPVTEVAKEPVTEVAKEPVTAAAKEPVIEAVTEPAKAAGANEAAPEVAKPTADAEELKAEREAKLGAEIEKIEAATANKLAELAKPLTDADFAAAIEAWIGPVGQLGALQHGAQRWSSAAREDLDRYRLTSGQHPDIVDGEFKELPAAAQHVSSTAVEEVQPSVEDKQVLTQVPITEALASVVEPAQMVEERTIQVSPAPEQIRGVSAPVAHPPYIPSAVVPVEEAVAPAEVGIVPADIADPVEQTPGEQTPGEQTPGEQTPGEQTPGKQTPIEQARAAGGLAAPAEAPSSTTPLKVADSITSRAIPEPTSHTSPPPRASASTPSSDEESSIDAVVPPVSRIIPEDEAEDVAEIKQYAERNRPRRRMRQS